MAGNLIREVRRSTVAHMKNDAGVTGIVDRENVHPNTTPKLPSWPFTRLDGFNSTAIDAACVAGATVTFLAHGFAQDRLDGGAVVETAEDHADRLGSAMHLALHNRRIPLAGASARLRVRSSRLQRDGAEESAYHVILSVEARVLAA